MSKKLLIAALAAMASSVAIADGAYSTLDADQSGSISEAEAAALPGLTEQWTALDTDTNGELSVEEFAKFETSDIADSASEAATDAVEAIEETATEAVDAVKSIEMPASN